MRFAAFAFVALGAAAASDLPKPDAPKIEAINLWAGISASRPIVEENANGEPLAINFALVNDGKKLVNPQLESQQLLINGQEMKDWVAIVNRGGFGDSRYEALPPGDYLHMRRVVADYFKKAGTYRVVWKGRHFRSAEIVIRVMPAKVS